MRNEFPLVEIEFNEWEVRTFLRKLASLPQAVSRGEEHVTTDKKFLKKLKTYVAGRRASADADEWFQLASRNLVQDLINASRVADQINLAFAQHDSGECNDASFVETMGALLNRPTAEPTDSDQLTQPLNDQWASTPPCIEPLSQSGYQHC